MSKISPPRRQKRWRAFLLIVLIYLAYRMLSAYPELVVEVGGTYEDMIKRSSAEYTPLYPKRFWWGDVRSPAKFRLFDAQYGFTAPAGPAIYITFDDYNIVQDVGLYPHMKPLTLDQALEVVLSLQEQWQTAGWSICNPHETAAVADTPEWRNQLRNARHGIDITWQAAGKYQARLILSQNFDPQNPDITPDLETYRLRVDVAKVRRTSLKCETAP